MDGLNVEQQQTRGATAPKTVTLRVTQQHVVSKNADWKSVLGKGNLLLLRHDCIVEEVK